MPLRPKFREHPIPAGDLRISRSAEEILVIHGLGSCVGVAITDPVAGVAGLAHVFLPDSSLLSPRQNRKPWNCADKAIPELHRQVLRQGARPEHLCVVVAGGAALGPAMTTPIGRANAIASVRALSALGLSPHHEMLGGHTWRTMKVIVSSGEVAVITDESIDLVDHPYRPGLAAAVHTKRRFHSVDDVVDCLGPLTDGVELGSSSRNFRPQNADEITMLLEHLVHEVEDAEAQPIDHSAVTKTDVASILEPLLSAFRRTERSV